MAGLHSKYNSTFTYTNVIEAMSGSWLFNQVIHHPQEIKITYLNPEKPRKNIPLFKVTGNCLTYPQAEYIRIQVAVVDRPLGYQGRPSTTQTHTLILKVFGNVQRI